MASARTLTEQAARELVDVYSQTEMRLLRLLSRRLAAGRSGPFDIWVAAKQAETARVILEARAVIRDGTVKGSAAVRRRLLAVSADAAAQAAAEMAVPVVGTPEVVWRIIRDTTDRLLLLEVPMLRSVGDAYQQVARRVAAEMTTGTVTLTDAIQRAVNLHADRGIGGFIDSAGRQWGLSEYSEMTTRTATARAYTETRLEQYASQGRNLVHVSDSPEECPWCRPWEGKVLAIAGPARSPAVATVAEATAAGLFHPNCTHSVALFTEGLSRPRGEPNPVGYEQRQRQRALERNVRRWKRREAAAFDPRAIARGKAYRREAERRLREFLRDTDRMRVGWRTRVFTRT